MKYFLITILAALFLAGCKSDDPASPSNNGNSQFAGVYKLSYISGNDTLSGSFNLNGTNKVITGSGSVKYAAQINSSYKSAETSGTLGGTYTDSSLSLSLNEFTFTGKKQNSNYTGTAVYIYYFSPTPDTITVQSALLVKQ